MNTQRVVELLQVLRKGYKEEYLKEGESNPDYLHGITVGLNLAIYALQKEEFISNVVHTPLVVYRVDTGFRHNDETTAEDIVNYEEKVLEKDNKIVYYARPFLKQFSHRQCFWVCKKKSHTLRYGKDPDQFVIQDYMIIGEDNHKGFLVLNDINVFDLY